MSKIDKQIIREAVKLIREEMKDKKINNAVIREQLGIIARISK